MNKIFIVFSLLIIFSGIVRIIYSERATFAQKYDEIYWKDRFEHSQWALPLSKRIIGDDGLYAYIGYRLIRGDGLDGFDAEVPPLGKYFIGLSILIFDNPYYYALFFGLGSLYIFYLIAKRALNNSVGAYFAVALLSLDPLFFSQFWKSALDICQLFFLLAHVLLFINFVNSKDNNRKKYILYALACGFSLGLFSQVKSHLFGIDKKIVDRLLGKLRLAPMDTVPDPLVTIIGDEAENGEYECGLAGSFYATGEKVRDAEC